MEKAYDIKVLGEKLKARGLDLAEESVKILLQETSAWVVESAAISPNPIDNVAALVLPEVLKVVLEQVDKIDGQVG